MPYDSFTRTDDLTDDLIRELERGGRQRVVDIHVDEMAESGDDLLGVAYAAVESLKSGAVEATVCIVRKLDGIDAVKFLSEQEGPVARDCPIRILEALTPTGHPDALEWRAVAAAENRHVDSDAPAM